MNNPYSWISIASVLIALVALIATQLTNRRTEGRSFVEQLENRIVDLRAEVKELGTSLANCKRHCQELMEENLALLRKVALGERDE